MFLGSLPPPLPEMGHTYWKREHADRRSADGWIECYPSTFHCIYNSNMNLRSYIKTDKPGGGCGVTDRVTKVRNFDPVATRQWILTLVRHVLVIQKGKYP